MLSDVVFRAKYLFSLVSHKQMPCVEFFKVISSFRLNLSPFLIETIYAYQLTRLNYLKSMLGSRFLFTLLTWNVCFIYAMDSWQFIWWFKIILPSRSLALSLSIVNAQEIAIECVQCARFMIANILLILFV